MHDVSSHTIDKALHLIAECIGNQANYRNSYPNTWRLIGPRVGSLEDWHGQENCCRRIARNLAAAAWLTVA